MSVFSCINPRPGHYAHTSAVEIFLVIGGVIKLALALALALDVGISTSRGSARSTRALLHHSSSRIRRAAGVQMRRQPALQLRARCATARRSAGDVAGGYGIILGEAFVEKDNRK